VIGRELANGNTVEVKVDEDEIRQAMAGPVRRIVEGAQGTLADAPPELTHDVLETGMFLTGGGSLLQGLDQLPRARSARFPVHVAEKPLETVAIGAGHMLEHLEEYRSAFQLVRPPAVADDREPGAEGEWAMTFSIVAFDPANGDLGVAVASKFPCVGRRRPLGEGRRRRRRDAGVGEHGLRPGRPAAHGGRDAGGAGPRRRAGRRRRPRRAPGGLRGRRWRGGDLHGFRMRRVGGRCLGRAFRGAGKILAGAGVVDAMARAFGSADG
jgi:hypothetical protein